MVIVLFTIMMMKRSEFVIQKSKKNVSYVQVLAILTIFIVLIVIVIFIFKMEEITFMVDSISTVNMKFQLKQICNRIMEIITFLGEIIVKFNFQV